MDKSTSFIDFINFRIRNINDVRNFIKLRELLLFYEDRANISHKLR